MTPEPAGKVLVTGAAGFIGRHAVARLAAAGWSVRAMVRGDRDAGLGGPGIEVVRGDVTDAGSLHAAVEGTVAVVHLAARMADEADSERVNVDGARSLVASCREAGCRRLVYVSTQSAKIARRGTYGETKRRAEEVFAASGLAVTTLRPSVVYGPERMGVFGTVAGFVDRLPVVPVLGDGRWISAPVWVGDVAAAIAASLARDETAGRTYDIGGPDQVSFDTLIDRIAESMGRRRRKLHVPFAVALAAARCLSVLPNPPVTVSNVLGSNQDTDIDIGPARRDLGFSPLGLEAGLGRVFPPPRPAAPVRPGAPAPGELERLSRYLLDREPPEVDGELERRYASACRRLLDGGAAAREWSFIERHPWSLPFVDAASALVAPDALVRRKLLIAAAVLEASPHRAEWFLEPPGGPVATVAGLGWQMARAAFKTAVGLPIWLVARRG